MAKGNTGEAYRPLDPDGDEFWGLYDALVPVFQKHLGPDPVFSAKGEAHRFLATYDSIRQDFWTKASADESLANLKRILIELGKAYSLTPNIVLGELPLNEEQLVELEKKKYMRETEIEVAFVSAIPLPEVRRAAAALDTLCKHVEGLISSIEMTRSSLPEGIKTRNRPIKEWALIEATVEIARSHDTINIPEDMDESGDMYRLLQDIFLVFGIKKSSFKGMFRGWKKYMDGKYENADLLTI